MGSTPPAEEIAKRTAAGTFVLGAAWIVALLIVSVFLLHIVPGAHAALAQALVSLLLSFVGFYWIALRRVTDARPLTTVGFARRPSQWQELGLGLAIGWGIAAAFVLPILLTGNLHTLVERNAIEAGQTLYSLALELLAALGAQLIFSGLVFRSLVRATSPVITVLSVAAVTGGGLALRPGHDFGEACFVAFASLLFSLAALRTRAIWVGTGLQVGWGVALNLLFGVGSFYWPATSGLVTSYVTGPRAITGGSLGPEASLWALFVVLAAVVILIRVTRDYAWNYAHDPIRPAGYPMDIAPPAEHTRMEAEAAARSVPLIQIQGIATNSDT